MYLRGGDLSNTSLLDCTGGLKHTLIVLHSNKILQLRDWEPEELEIFDMLDDWHISDCGAGDEFNVILLKNNSTGSSRLLSWGESYPLVQDCV